MKEEVKRLIKEYRRKQKRAERKEERYKNKKTRLSIYGWWGLGYYSACSFVYANIADDLEDMLRECRKQSSVYGEAEGRDIPKKMRKVGSLFLCPECGCSLSLLDNFCCSCGQRLESEVQ